MDDGRWDPHSQRPDDLVWPLRAGRTSRDDTDLTWRIANGPGYERVGRGRYVPAARRRSVEQRIVDAAARLPADGSAGCVTGWAALRWQGASYFDGLGAHGVGELPVEMVVPYCAMRPVDGVVAHRRAIGRRERHIVAGLPVATVPRALFDEIHTRDELWGAVQAIDMTAAARLTSVLLFATFVGWCNSRNGAPLARDAVSMAVDESRSPREPWLRLVWCRVAGLPVPLVNEPVYTLDGRLVGVPDLFDPEAGLVGEYSGEIHKHRERHRRDVAREADFRDLGLEYVEIVSGDTKRVAAERILGARARARFLPPESRRWTLERPPWDPAPETLDAYFDRTGQVDRLTACDSAPPDGDSSLLGRPLAARERWTQ